MPFHILKEIFTLSRRSLSLPGQIVLDILEAQAQVELRVCMHKSKDILSPQERIYLVFALHSKLLLIGKLMR